MATQPATAFSYVRFSSKKQEQGDSVRRQLDLTAAWAKRHKIHLDTTLKPDRGISAFRGKNRDLGALGEFLRLVDNGRVLPGSFLVVESLDRLTREEIQPALLLILSLLQKGIRVVQLKPSETIYDSASDTTPIILMLVELSRGHSESKVKSDRVRESWDQRRKSARAGAILAGRLPLWVEERDGKLALIPERAEAVRRIFELSASGMGVFSVRVTLDKEKVPAFGPSGRWSTAYLDLILRDRRAVGEWQPKLRGGKPDGDPIKDYFPAVVSEELWERVRMGARQRFRPRSSEPGRRTAGRTGEKVNVFQGMLKSAKDGFAYVVGGVSKKHPFPTLRAIGQRMGTGRADSFPLESFEKAILSCLREIDPHEVLNGETQDESLHLAARLRDVETQLTRIEAELVNVTGDVPALVRATDALERQRKELADKLANARRKAAHPLSESWGETKSLLVALKDAPDEREARLRLREALRRIVEEIRILVVPRGRDRICVAQLWFAGETHGVQHRDYLIFHRAAKSGPAKAGEDRPPAQWAVKSFADAGIGPFDLRQSKDAKKLQRALEAETP